MDTDPPADPPFAAILAQLDRINRRLDAIVAPEPLDLALPHDAPKARADDSGSSTS